MPNAKKPVKTSATGFAIPILPNTDLGSAILIIESEDGQHQPISIASSINEAREVARADLRERTRKLERGEDAGICPFVYKLWARGIDGTYRTALEIPGLA